MIFKRQYKKTQEQLSFVSMDREQFEQWSLVLLSKPLGEACQELLIALIELQQLKSNLSLRFEFIQLIHNPTVYLLNDLENLIKNQATNYNIDLTLVKELLIDIRCYFIRVYVDFSQDIYQILKEKRLPVWNFVAKYQLKKYHTQTVYYALQQMSILMYQQQHFHQDVLPDQWLTTHQLYQMALHLEEHLSPMMKNMSYQPEFTLNSIEQTYMQILLFDIISHAQLLEHEIDKLYQCSFNWVTKMSLQHEEYKNSKYKVALSRDVAPMVHNDANRLVNVDLFIEFDELVLYLSSQHYNNKNQDELTPALKFHVEYKLINQYERKYERYEYSAVLDIYVGYHQAYQFLTRNDINKQNQFLYHIVRYQANVTDKSINGYKIYWNDEIPYELKKGAYLLLSEQNNKQQEDVVWQSAIIRWIRHLGINQVEMGVEVLSRSQVTGYIRFKEITEPVILIRKHVQKNNMWSVLLKSDTRIPNGVTVELHIQQKNIQILLSKALLVSQNFVQSDIKLQENHENEILSVIFE